MAQNETAGDICKLVKITPQALGLSLDENLKPKLAWLNVRLVLDDEASPSWSRVGQDKTASSWQVLSCSIQDNLKSKLAWLKVRLELDDEGICKSVKRWSRKKRKFLV
jgi:hypothetical protein